ncbi:MAG: hypothetical protein HYZ58_16035 [Acidobacteria bacterium]|nr:hypothetical protein [Acidobacteriota bacterium]MBI3264635.1 hypothetical protein [Acidobacteriota bacterium]
MLKNRLLLTAIALIILAGLLFWARRRAAQRAPEIDLVAQFETAEKRSNMPLTKAFEIRDLTVNGETRKSIFEHPTSRITWRITVPDDAVLRTWIALAPDAWNKEGDGVLFRVGVSDGARYQELAKEHVNPYAEQSDRRWRPITIDLSWYGGRQVDLIFNTNSSLPDKGDNAANDWAYWGAPAIYARE